MRGICMSAFQWLFTRAAGGSRRAGRAHGDRQGRAGSVTPFVNAAPSGSRSAADPALQLLVTPGAAGRVRLDRE